MASDKPPQSGVSDITQNSEPTMINLGKPSLRTRLEAYYSLISPETIANQQGWRTKFSQIYQKYGGTVQGEQRLASKLAKKYGTAVRLLTVNSDDGASLPQGSADPSEAEGMMRDERWYALRPGQRGSGVLDFRSEKFDPQAVLRARFTEVEDQNPGLADCHFLDTVGKFAIRLPKVDPLRKEKMNPKRRKPSPPSTGSVKKTRQLHPFDSISSASERGPLSVLGRCHRQRITVVIRYVNAIRGEITGVLVCFDKHMNMIMRDAVETYNPRPHCSMEKSNMEIELDRRATSKTSFEGGWARRRTMKQIMVRGDNVVSVYRADEARVVSKSIYHKKMKM